MERAFLTRLDHQLFIAPATYASTYFELCSLVPSSSEEALRRQLHRMTELAGACLSSLSVLSLHSLRLAILSDGVCVGVAVEVVSHVVLSLTTVPSF